MKLPVGNKRLASFTAGRLLYCELRTDRNIGFILLHARVQYLHYINKYNNNCWNWCYHVNSTLKVEGLRNLIYLYECIWFFEYFFLFNKNNLHLIISPSAHHRMYENKNRQYYKNIHHLAKDRTKYAQLTTNHH